MEYLNRQKIYKTLIMLGTGLFIVLLIGFNQKVLEIQRNSDQLWQNYISEEARISKSLNRLYQLIGFEGFIHHYKNYLIRQTPGDLEQLRIDTLTLRKEFKELSLHLKHPEDLLALDQLDYIFSRYVGQIDEITRLIEHQHPIQYIDRLVKIDEPTAVLALETLNQSVQRSLNLAREEAQQQMDYSGKLALFNYLLSLPLLGIAFYILWLFNRSSYLLSQSREANEQINRLLDTTPEPMLFIDQRGKIVRVNQQAVEFFGYPVEHLTNMQVEQLLPVSLRKSHIGLRQAFQKNPKTQRMNQGRAVKIELANQQMAEVQIHLGVVKHQSEMLTIASIRDVTQERKDQEQLRNSHRELAETLQKLQHLTHHLAETEKMAALGTLVAGVSHEINTPLGVSLTAITHLFDQTEVLKADFKTDKLSVEQLEEYLNAQLETASLVTRNLQHAAGLINNFKQVAIDQAHNELRKFDLCSYVNDALSSIKPSFKHRAINIRFDCDLSESIVSYPGAISQIINNLVMNSVQHGFPEQTSGIISLQVLFDALQKQFVLRVSDNGVGIDPKAQKHIFEPFYTTARTEGGSGLGLNIVYNLVTQLLHGDIQVKSELGHGTETFITLPMEIAPADTDE